MTLQPKRISIGFKKQDIWLGIYYDSKNIYICLIPCLPIKIVRSSSPKGSVS